MILCKIQSSRDRDNDNSANDQKTDTLISRVWRGKCFIRDILLYHCVLGFYKVMDIWICFSNNGKSFVVSLASATAAIVSFILFMSEKYFVS